MLDKLNRLEKLGYLESVEQWNVLRAIRNRLAHDYPLDEGMRAAYMNEAVNSAALLSTLLARVQASIPA